MLVVVAVEAWMSVSRSEVSITAVSCTSEARMTVSSSSEARMAISGMIKNYIWEGARQSSQQNETNAPLKMAPLQESGEVRVQVMYPAPKPGCPAPKPGCPAPNPAPRYAIALPVQWAVGQNTRLERTSRHESPPSPLTIKGLKVSGQ